MYKDSPEGQHGLGVLLKGTMVTVHLQSLSLHPFCYKLFNRLAASLTANDVQWMSLSSLK